MPFEAPVTIATLPVSSLIASLLSLMIRRLDNCRNEDVKASRNLGLYFRQPVEIGAQHPALEDKVCELAFAQDIDQAGGLEFLDVMGQGRGADALALVQGAARRRRVVLADLLEDLNATWL